MTGLRNATILSLLVSTMFLATACGGTQAAKGPDGGTPAADGGGGGGGGGTDGGVGGPTVKISAPANGASVAAGAQVTFTGSATDPTDGTLTGGALAWTSDKDGALGQGASIKATLTTVGSQTITLTATDKAGKSASASIKITVTAANAPVVKITEPAGGTQVAIGQALTFKATVKAPAGATIKPQNIKWTSNVDGALGAGNPIQNGLATPGTQTITCTATDSNGHTGSDSINLTVTTHRAPKVTITSPQDGSYFLQGASITFQEATQFYGGATQQGTVQWKDTSGTWHAVSNPAKTSLALGDHTVSVTVTDTQGAVGTAKVTVHVVTHLPPQCRITNPNAGDTFVVGEPVTFRGTCTDPTTNTNLTGAQLVWSSNVDGNLGTGNRVTAGFSTASDQTVSLCGTYSGTTGCATVQVHVIANTAPTCKITAPAPNTVIQAGDRVQLVGSVTDAEDPSITGMQPGAKWTDDLGHLLGSQATVYTTFQTTQMGNRTLTLTGTDSGALTCTKTVQVYVNIPPTPQITSVKQGTNTNTATFNTTGTVSVQGTASDPDGDSPFSYVWTDSLAGAFSTNATANLTAPLAGHHTLWLSATDQNGGTGTVTATFTAMPNGQTQLVQPYNAVNSGIRNQSVHALAVTSGNTVYLGDGSQRIYHFDGTMANATAIPDGQISDWPYAIALDGTHGYAYFGTHGSGLIVCAYNATTGTINAQGGCTQYRPGGMDQVFAVARMDVNATSYLLVGGNRGLFLTTNLAGSNAGIMMIQNTDVHGIAVDGNDAWVAAAGGNQRGGLYEVDPTRAQGANNGVLNHWNTNAGAISNNLYAVAVGSGAQSIWVGSDRGLGRFQPNVGANNGWTDWRAGGAPTPGLIGNTVNAVAVAPTMINGVNRDVIWVGTNSGVSRFDPSIPSFMNLTTADGLPGNTVTSIVVLNDATPTKVFATSGGVARYTGK